MNHKKYHRVYVDGCFDLCHFGHFNFIRQAFEFGDELYAGVHNDEEILKNKGPVVFTLEERMTIIESCKWVTRAIPNSPYDVSVEWLDKYHCDCNIHGDDLALNADGIECHDPVRKAGRFETVPRTKSISTTNIIGRMLRLPISELPEGFNKSNYASFEGESHSLQTYIPSIHRIAQFSNNEDPKKDACIVYCDGTFDLLHPGHVSFLKKAKELGDYLVVGIHDDSTIPGRMKPIMTLQERVLNVLALKYVDDVIIGAPNIITNELINQVKPSIVVEGSNPTKTNHEESYRIPAELGIYKKIESDYPDFSTKTVINRIFDKYSQYTNRNAYRESLPCEQI